MGVKAACAVGFEFNAKAQSRNVPKLDSDFKERYLSRVIAKDRQACTEHVCLSLSAGKFIAVERGELSRSAK